MNGRGEFPIVRLSLMIYLPMIALGVFSRPPGSVRVQEPMFLLAGLALAAVLGATVVTLSRWATRHTGWGQSLQEEFRKMLGRVNSRQVLLLSLLSSFGEEFLFRGVLQPRLGWILATLLFGALHFPLRRTLIPWCGFAMAVGLVLAGLTEWFRSLWPAILLHFMVNYLNLHDLAGKSLDQDTLD